jgi:hypothetical protein
MIGKKIIVALNIRHFSQVGKPSLAEAVANCSVFQAGKTPSGI